jgi:outer membrane protein TolC
MNGRSHQSWSPDSSLILQFLRLFSASAGATVSASINRRRRKALALLLGGNILAQSLGFAFSPTQAADDAAVNKSAGAGNSGNSSPASSATNSPTGSTTNSEAPPTPFKLAEPLTSGESTKVEHDVNKTLNLSPLYLNSAVEMHSFGTLRSEATYDQSIRLPDAIKYVLDNGMQIKISRESLIYQHWATMAQTAAALPSFTLQYNLSHAHVKIPKTAAHGKQIFAGVSMPVFAGGGTLATILAQRYREKAWRYTYVSTYQDVFLNVYQNYTNLLLQRVLLQISAKAVEADQELVRINTLQLNSGTGTRFAVLQAQAQLTADRQAFLNQEVAMRQAALALNSSLNYPMDVNLIPVEETLSEANIFSEKVSLKDLIDDALTHHPGLRQYENFRYTANRNINVVASNYYPNVAFFVGWQYNDVGVAPNGNGQALSGVATSAITSLLNTSFTGRVSNNALGQQQGFSPTIGTTSSQGANTAPVALPAASGGVPIYALQSGSAVSSGAVAPSIFGGGTGNPTSANGNGSLQAPAGIFPGVFKEWQAGFALNWTVPNGGLGITAGVLQAKNLARQAMLQCNQELTLVEQNVRTDYLNIKTARQLIDKAAAAVAASREALRIARLRLNGGVGTNYEVITAQKDYITNLTTQAQAIVSSNVAQAKLLHDIGMIDATTLSTGYRRGVYEEPRPTKKINWIYP